MKRCCKCYCDQHHWKRVGWWPSHVWICRHCGMLAVRTGLTNYELFRRLDKSVSVIMFQRDANRELKRSAKIMPLTYGKLDKCPPEGW